MSLTIVHAKEPSPKQAVIERYKNLPRINGMVHCNRCGSSTILNTIGGVLIKNGRRQRGIKLDVAVCYHCHMQGIFTSMFPTFRDTSKPVKPRKRKPKLKILK